MNKDFTGKYEKGYENDSYNTDNVCMCDRETARDERI